MYTDSTHTCPLFKFMFSLARSPVRTAVKTVYNTGHSLFRQQGEGVGRLHTVLTPLAVPGVRCQGWRWKGEKLAAFYKFTCREVQNGW